jgi:hypothetical protein
MDEIFFKNKFDWKAYVGKYEDLQKANINTKRKAWNHARRHGHKENRDIFKGDRELLRLFRNFCITGKVKPIPEKYKYNTITNFISNINNDKTILIFYIDYLKSKMGVQNIFNLKYIVILIILI